MTLPSTRPARRATAPAPQRLYDRALAEAFRGRYDLSRRHLRHALETLEGDGVEEVTARRLQIRLLVLLGRLEHELDGADGGRTHFDRAVLIAEDIAAYDLVFVVHESRGLRAMRDGRSEEALLHFLAAERLAPLAADLDAARLFVNRGTLRLQRLELGDARRDFERGLQRLGSDAASVTVRMMARHNLGYLEFLRGDLPAALGLMRSAAEVGGAAAPAVALLDRARVLIAAGLTDAADRCLDEAAEEFRRGRMWPDLAEAEVARAELALLTGRFGRTRRLAASARSRFRRRGNDAWRRRAELVLLAGDLADGRPPSLLAAPALRLAQGFGAEGLAPYATTARLIAVEALLRAGRPAAAEEAYADLPRPRRTDLIEVRLQRRTVAAQLERALGDTTAATREVRLGLEDLARYQSRFGSVDLQTASALHGRRLAALDLDLALETGRAAAVFATLERGRERSRRLVPVTPPSGDSAPLLVELRQLTTTLHEIGADPGRRQEAQAVRERTAALQEDLRGLSWQVGGRGRATAATSLVEVRDRLTARGRQMLLLGRRGDELVAVVLGRGRPRLVRLAGTAARAAALTRTVRADLDVVARPRLPARLRDTASASARHKLAALDAVLLDALRLGTGLADAPLVVVPTADLSTLPWGCLPSLRGRPVEVAPTAGAWWRRAATSGDDAPLEPHVVALAGPDVPAAAAEVQQVAATWAGSRVLRGDDATAEAFAAASAGATLAHVAAHGHHVAQNPLFSSLDLAGGPLFAYELRAEQVPAHVVLSACELGQATVRPGEESLGLTSVLLQLGARCVVAGVAEVADERAAAVMVGYHRRLAEGSDSAVALADATSAAEDPDGPGAPFTCFGAAVRFA